MATVLPGFGTVSTVLHDYAVRSGMLWELSCIQEFDCATRPRIPSELQYCMMYCRTEVLHMQSANESYLWALTP